VQKITVGSTKPISQAGTASETIRAAEFLDVGLETGRTPETQIDRAIRGGLSFHSLQSVLDRVGMSLTEIAEPLMIQPRTLSRRKKEGRLTPEESDRLFRLVRIFAHAESVFGAADRARRWLRETNRALGGRVPLELIETDIGTTMVDDVLGRIEHGVFA
jgi:putative toxin-antitoxin system antitoxin component (TIGR02293 family)